jgi:hypothetical protein
MFNKLLAVLKYNLEEQKKLEKKQLQSKKKNPDTKIIMSIMNNKIPKKNDSKIKRFVFTVADLEA